jgi:hypothetical protein
MVIKKVQKKVEEIPRMIPVKLKEKELEIGLQDANLTIARLQSQVRKVPLSLREETEQTEMLRQRAVELTQSKAPNIGAQMRQQWFGGMALLRLAEGKHDIAALAIAMGMLEERAPEGARNYLYNYQPIYNIVESGIPATPAMMNRFRTEIEVTSVALDNSYLANSIQRIRPEKRKLVTDAVKAVEQRLEEGSVDRARELLDMASQYTDLSRVHHGKTWKGSVDMEEALLAEIGGRRAVAQYGMGMSYYYYSTEIEAFRSALNKWWSADLRKPMNDALDMATGLAEKGEFGKVQRLLTLLQRYTDSVGKLGMRKREKVASLSKEDAELTRSMKDAIEAIVKDTAVIDDERTLRSFEKSHRISQTAYANRKLEELEETAKKMKEGREILGSAIAEVKKRMSAGNPTGAIVLLQYIEEYTKSYRLLTGKEVADYTEARKEMLGAIGNETRARTRAAHTRAAQLLESAAARIIKAKALQDEFSDFQRRWKGEVPFVDRIPGTKMKGPKGSIPLWEIEKGRYQTLSLDEIRKEDRNITGAKLNEYMKKLENAVARGDADVYYAAKRKLYDRMLLVADVHLRKGALAEMATPLRTSIEPMLKDLKKMYSAQPVKEVEKLYKEAYPITKEDGRPYMDARKKFLHAAALFHEGMPKTEVRPGMKPALDRVAELEKRRVGLLKEIEHYGKTKEPMPALLVQQYWRFMKDVDLERKKATSFEVFVRQLSLNESYHIITGEMLGTIASFARSKLRDSRKLLEEGCTLALLATSRKDFVDVEKKFREAIHARRIALGMYSAEALKIKGGEKLAKKYEGAPQYAFYEDAHASLFHGILYGFENLREQENTAKIDEALRTLEFSVFEVPADAMSQLPSDFSSDQERVRSLIESAIVSYKSSGYDVADRLWKEFDKAKGGWTRSFQEEQRHLIEQTIARYKNQWPRHLTGIADRQLDSAKDLKKEMEGRVKRNKEVAVVVTIAGSFAAGWAIAPFATGAAFTTQALDGVVTEYSMYNKASAAAWGGLAFMVVSMGIGEFAQIFRAAAEYKAAAGATRYAAGLMGTARALNYTNMVLGVSFVGYMSIEATLAFTEGRIFEGLLAAGFAAYPIAAAPRGVELFRLSRRRAKFTKVLDNVLPFRGPLPPRGAPPGLGLPRGTLNAAELMNPATLQNMVEALTIPRKATIGETSAARMARMRRNGARASLKMIEAEHPEVANAIRELGRSPDVNRFIETGEGAKAAENALKDGAGRIKDMLPPEAVEAAEAAEVRLLKAVGAEGVEAIGFEMPRRAPVEMGRPLEVVAIKGERPPPGKVVPGKVEPTVGVGKAPPVERIGEAKVPAAPLEAPPPTEIATGKARFTKENLRGAFEEAIKGREKITKEEFSRIFEDILRGKGVDFSKEEFAAVTRDALAKMERLPWEKEKKVKDKYVSRMKKNRNALNKALSELVLPKYIKERVVGGPTDAYEAIRGPMGRTIELLDSIRPTDTEKAAILADTLKALHARATASDTPPVTRSQCYEVMGRIYTFENARLALRNLGDLKLNKILDGIDASLHRGALKAGKPYEAFAESLANDLRMYRERRAPENVMTAISDEGLLIAETIQMEAAGKIRNTWSRISQLENVEIPRMVKEGKIENLDMVNAELQSLRNYVKNPENNPLAKIERLSGKHITGAERAQLLLKFHDDRIITDATLGQELKNAGQRAAESIVTLDTKGNDVLGMLKDGSALRLIEGGSVDSALLGALRSERVAETVGRIHGAATEAEFRAAVQKGSLSEAVNATPKGVQELLSPFVNEARMRLSDEIAIIDSEISQRVANATVTGKAFAGAYGPALRSVPERMTSAAASRWARSAFIRPLIEWGWRWTVGLEYRPYVKAREIMARLKTTQMEKLGAGGLYLLQTSIWGTSLYFLGQAAYRELSGAENVEKVREAIKTLYEKAGVPAKEISRENALFLKPQLPPTLRGIPPSAWPPEMKAKIRRGMDFWTSLQHGYPAPDEITPPTAEKFSEELANTFTYYLNPLKINDVLNDGREIAERLDGINELLLARKEGTAEERKEAETTLKTKLKEVNISLQDVDRLLEKSKEKELDMMAMRDLKTKEWLEKGIFVRRSDLIAAQFLKRYGATSEHLIKDTASLIDAAVQVRKRVMLLQENNDVAKFLWDSVADGYLPGVLLDNEIDRLAAADDQLKALKDMAGEKSHGKVAQQLAAKAEGYYVVVPAGEGKISGIVPGSFLRVLDEMAISRRELREKAEDLIKKYRNDSDALAKFNNLMLEHKWDASAGAITEGDYLYGDFGKLAELVKGGSTKKEVQEQGYIGPVLLSQIDPTLLTSADAAEIVGFIMRNSGKDEKGGDVGVLNWITTYRDHISGKAKGKGRLSEIVRSLMVRADEVEGIGHKGMESYLNQQTPRYRNKRLWLGPLPSEIKAPEKAKEPEKKEAPTIYGWPVGKVGTESEVGKEKVITISVDEAAMQMPEGLRIALDAYVGEDGLLKKDKEILRVFENDAKKMRGYAYNMILEKCKNVLDLPETIARIEKEMKEASGKERTRLKKELRPLKGTLKADSNALKKAGIEVTRKEGMMKIDFVQSTKTELGMQSLLKRILSRAKRRK